MKEREWKTRKEKKEKKKRKAKRIPKKFAA